MWWLALLACDDDEAHPCDAGTPTCESSMVLELPDPRTAFELHVSDELGLDLQITCPSAENPYVVGEATVACGAGSVMVTRYEPFGEEITVKLEELPDNVYTPRWQNGSDYCGNLCTLGTIEL